jgi:hypothetical protein
VAIHPERRGGVCHQWHQRPRLVVDLMAGAVVKEIPGAPSRGLRPDIGRLPVCGEPYRGHRVHLLHWQSRLTRSPLGPCQLDVTPRLLRSRIGAPVTSPTTWSSSPRSSPSSTRLRRPFNLGGEVRDLGKRGVVQAFPAGNGNPPITKITLSRSPIPAFSPAARTSARAPTLPTSLSRSTAQTRTYRPLTPSTRTTSRGCSQNQLLSAVIRGNRLYVTVIGSLSHRRNSTRTCRRSSRRGH